MIALILVILLQITIQVRPEIIEFNNFKIHPNNTVINIKKFVFLNQPHENSSQSGFNYSLMLDNSNYSNWFNNHFHMYIIKSDAIPHFEFINNPAICCSEKGGIICDEYSKETDNKNPSNVLDIEKNRLVNYSSVYSYSLELNKSEVYNITDSKELHLEGMYYTLFLLCSEKKFPLEKINSDIVLNGKITFYNYNGFLSAELLFNTDLYIAISFAMMISAVLWIWRLTNPIYLKNTFQKMFTVTILSFLFESLLNFHIYNETLYTGIDTLFFEILNLLFSTFRNISIRLIIFCISLGYIYLEKDIDPKKVSKATNLIICYSISITFYCISLAEYKINKDSLSFLILAAFIYACVDIYLVYEVLTNLDMKLTYLSYHNDLENYNVYKYTWNVVISSIVFSSLWVALEIFYKFFSNYHDIWKIKWLIGILNETSNLLLFFLLVYLLFPRIDRIEKFGTQPEMDEFSNEHNKDDFKILELS